MRLSRLLKLPFLGATLCTFCVLSAGATETRSYTYDALGRLMAQATDGAVNDDQSRTYCYDRAGNRTRVVADEAGGAAACPSLAPVQPVPAELSIDDQIVVEGGTMSFTVSRSGRTSIAASASYATSNDTASSPGDYIAKANTVAFSPGQTSAAISVDTVDDGAAESTEAFNVTLMNPSTDTTIVKSVGIGTIEDNDTSVSGAPTAVNDVGLAILCGEIEVFDLTANDSDPENDPISLFSATIVSGTLGNVSIYSSSSIQVTAGGKTGPGNPVVLVYTIKDSNGFSDSANVEISVGGPNSYCNSF